jgi:hypothetical protein
MNPSYRIINQESTEIQAKPPKINPTNQTEDLGRSWPWARLVYQFYTLERLHNFTHKSWATLVVHHTSLGEMTSKHTTRPLQRITLVRCNR